VPDVAAVTVTPLARLRARVRNSGLILLGTYALGVLGYRALEGVGETWLDAFYMTANVLATVGFREAVRLEDNAPAQIFTMVLLATGMVTVVYFTSAVTAFVVEGDLSQEFRRRRMERLIGELADHYIICGGGQTGTAVLRELLATRRPVVMIDKSEEAAAHVGAEFPEVPVIVGDITDDEVLTRAGVRRAAGLAVCVDSDKDSLVATVVARQLNPGLRVISRGTDERALTRLRGAGASSAVSPGLIGGMRIASELVRPTVVTFLDRMLRDHDRTMRVEEVELGGDSVLAGVSVGRADLRRRANVLLLAVRPPEADAFVYNPADDTVLAPGTQLILMGDEPAVRRLRDVAAGRAAV
jgi:voltage-gated potassium channel